MDREEASGNEDAPLEGNQVDGPPAKRAHTARVIWDSDETAFASSLFPLGPLPDAMFQSNDMHSNYHGDGDGTVCTDRKESDGDINMEGGDGIKYDQEGVGFQDNGVCFQFFFFQWSYQHLLFILRCQCLMAMMEPHLIYSILVPVLVLVCPHPQPLLRVPIKSPKGISPLRLVN